MPIQLPYRFNKCNEGNVNRAWQEGDTLDQENYWKRRAPRTTRRRFLAGSAAATAVAALGLAGCGDDDDDGGEAKSASPTAKPGASPTAALKPVAGGVFKVIGGPVGGSLDPHRTNTPVEYGFIWPAAGNFLVRFGIKDGLAEADLAAALPEIPGDGTELIFKIRPDAKFQNKAPANGRG